MGNFEKVMGEVPIRVFGLKRRYIGFLLIHQLLSIDLPCFFVGSQAGIYNTAYTGKVKTFIMAILSQF